MIKHGRGYTITRTPLQTRYVMFHKLRHFVASARDDSGQVAEVHADLTWGITFQAMRAREKTERQWWIYGRLIDYAKREVRRLRAEEKSNQSSA